MSMMDKVVFHLEHEEDDYPPIEVELLNATVVSDDLFRIDNAPFFASNVSYHDIIRARKSEIDGQFDFVELVEGSTFTSISIIILDSSMDVYLMDLLRGLNCVVEYGEFGKIRVLAVAVPESTDYPKLRKQLEILEGQSKLSFAELAI